MKHTDRTNGVLCHPFYNYKHNYIYENIRERFMLFFQCENKVSCHLFFPEEKRKIKKYEKGKITAHYVRHCKKHLPRDKGSSHENNLTFFARIFFF